MEYPVIDQNIIHEYTTDSSFQRGEQYYQSGAVISLIQRDSVLSAKVVGSDYDPYEVQIEFEDGEIFAECSCPYDWGGWCKHIVAVLLRYIREPEAIEKRPSLLELLVTLDKDQLEEVIIDLVDQYPHLIDVVEEQVEDMQARNKGIAIA